MNPLESMPSSVYAERLVLGSLLLRGERFPEFRDVVSAGDFSLEKHARIWQCMERLHAAGTPVDRATIGIDLHSRGELESVDGLTYLASLDEGLPEIYNLEAYAATVVDKATRRRLIRSAYSLAERAASGVETTADLLDSVRALSDCAGPARANLQSPSEIIEAAGGLDAYLAESSLSGVPYPVEALTHSTGGMQPGDLIVLAAGTGRGKTAFALWAALCAARAGVGTAIFSQEMSNRQILNRMLSHQAGVNSRRLRRINDCTPDEMRAIGTGAADLCDSPLYLRDTSGLTVPGLIGAVRRERALRPIGFVIVDYLQLVKGPGKNRVEQVGAVARGLKEAAMELGLPIMALSQFSRPLKEARGAPPDLADLKDSSEIEQAANAVLFLHGSTSYESTPLEALPVDLIVAKMRDGAAGYPIRLTFRADCGRFSEVA